MESRDYPRVFTQPIAGHDRILILEDGQVFGSTANSNESAHFVLKGVEAQELLANGAIHPITDDWRQHAPVGRYSAASGHDMYTSRLFPREYWGRAGFVCEPTAHLVAQFFFAPKGSTWAASLDATRYNIFASKDAWTAPIMAKVGPDGALWVLDWYTYITQHNGDPTGPGNAFITPLRTKKYCRIYRVIPRGKPLETVLDLRGATPAHLAQALSNPNFLWRMQAQRLLLAKAAVDSASARQVAATLKPLLSSRVRDETDNDPKRFRFLVSGSSARKLRKGHANPLPGRIHVHHLHPLLASELGNDFNLNRVLAHGSLPGIYAEKDPRERAATLSAYADIYLRQEIQAEALVRDVGGYGRLLEIVAASSGKILNLNAVCRDAGIRYETARRYLEVLVDTLVAFSVPAWSGSDRASLVAHPKVFLFDLGVRNSLLRRPLDAPLEDEKGVLLEHLAAYEIHRRIGGLWPDAKLSHYRNRHGAEVDFVVEAGKEIWGIEVKSSRDSAGVRLSGLESLQERAGRPNGKIVVFLGNRKQVREGVEFLPLESFLQELPV